MKSYMADYGQGFMVSKNFRHAYLQEVGLTQLSGDPDRFQDIFQGIFQHTKVHNIFQDRQTPPSSYLRLGEF